jgi:DNA mismatch repair protein MutS
VDGCVNVHLDATEHGDGLVFLHAVKDGPANRSYGLQVAQLAGVPREVIVKAREYLTALESDRDGRRASSAQTELPLFAPPPERDARADALVAEIENLNPDDLSPKEALAALYRLRDLVA